MNIKHQRTIILILILVGFLVSLHLIRSHYTHSSEGEICDINGVLSCTIINTSKYSEIFHVPVAIFGSIWFIVAFPLAWNVYKKKHNQTILFAWTIVGLISITYFIIIEIILQAICLYCTIVHIIITILFVIMLFQYRNQQDKLSRQELFKLAKPWLIAIIIITLIPFLYINFKPVPYYNDFAKCLTEKDVKFYGAFWCSHCARQKQLFGDAMQQINYVECSLPDRSGQTQICLNKNITGYPTWEFADGTHLSGEQPLETLSKKTGCPLQKTQS